MDGRVYVNAVCAVVHRFIVGLLRRLPLPVSQPGCFLYDKLLRSLASHHVGQTAFGAHLRCDSRDLIQRMIFYFGVWEPNISHAIRRLLTVGDVFVDIGANVGYHTLLGSKCVGPSGRVVAIEASPRAFQLLAENLALNSWASNVRAVNLAVADQAGSLRLYGGSAFNIGATSTMPARGGLAMEEVAALPLDEILTNEERSRVRLIKIDIEGTEPTILRRLLTQLDRWPRSLKIIVEASPEDNSGWESLFVALLAAGFQAFAIENQYSLEWYLRWRVPAKLEPVHTMPSCQQDLLFSRDDIDLSS